MRFAQLRKSFSYAWRGIRHVYTHEQNFRIQIFFAALVCLVGVLFGISRAEWIVLLWLIIFVLVLELLNSALETFADILKPRLHLQVGVVKDIMAGMVLISSIGALVIGITIFWPYIVELLGY